jgi:L-ascorbate metabolism protein UlaG (beta-lactamase superfamily)
MAFQNLDPNHRRPSRRDALRRVVWDRWLRRKARPADGPPAPAITPDWSLIREPAETTRLTWIGHASVLVQIAGRNVLIDPVFSPRIGYLFPRLGPLGLRSDQLPRIDLVIVTHNHYDHLDAASIAAIPRTATVVTPSRLGAWFRRYGFARIIELGWWEGVQLDALQVTCVPSRHWSRRGVFDTNATLWGGFVMSGGGCTVYHAGDSAWFEGFREIGRRFPAIDAALLPIGGYAPQWFMQHNHFTPEQAGDAFLHLGARWMLPIHWGTFRLSDEPLREPIERLLRWWESRSDLDRAKLRDWSIGETVVVGSVGADR